MKQSEESRTKDNKEDNHESLTNCANTPEQETPITPVPQHPTKRTRALAFVTPEIRGISNVLTNRIVEQDEYDCKMERILQEPKERSFL